MEHILPDYVGGSTVNLVASLAHRYGAETAHAPLAAEFGTIPDGEVTVLVIADAMGRWQLNRHVINGDMPHLAQALSSPGAMNATLTSVFPSTTAAALTSLHTGRTPAEHGMLGYTTWLPEEATVAQLLGLVSLPSEAALRDRERLFRVPSVYTALAERGVACHAFMPEAIHATPLSGWHFAGATVSGYRALEDVPGLAAQTIDHGTGSQYVVIYWPAYDTVCHLAGPTSAKAGARARQLDAMLGDLVTRLSHRDDVSLVLTADHGQRALEPYEAMQLDEMPELYDQLDAVMGERCARYLRVKSGATNAVSALLEPYAEVEPTAKMWAEGWFGDPDMSPELAERVGDLLAVPRDGRQLRYRPLDAVESEVHRGGHGGWSAEEMLVPMVALRPSDVGDGRATDRHWVDPYG